MCEEAVKGADDKFSWAQVRIDSAAPDRARIGGGPRGIYRLFPDPLIWFPAALPLSSSRPRADDESP
ncbi:hypothetical protein C100_14415 [Sphingobium sp. C100]|nr:hypothetical protein C100_14415 [Sphingobium sp. C100]